MLPNASCLAQLLCHLGPVPTTYHLPRYLDYIVRPQCPYRCRPQLALLALRNIHRSTLSCGPSSLNHVAAGRRHEQGETCGGCVPSALVSAFSQAQSLVRKPEPGPHREAHLTDLGQYSTSIRRARKPRTVRLPASCHPRDCRDIHRVYCVTYLPARHCGRAFDRYCSGEAYTDMTCVVDRERRNAQASREQRPPFNDTSAGAVRASA